MPTVSFDTPESLEAFSFLPGTDPLAPGQWAWLDGSNPHLVQTARARLAGTFAIYDAPPISDGSVEFRGWSTSQGAMGAVLRYVDADHFYAFSAGRDSYQILKVDGESSELLTCAGPLFACGNTPAGYGPEILCPGVTIKFEANGDMLRGFVDGVLVAEAQDLSYASGQVGLVTHALDDAHFDDFIVQTF